MTFDESQYKLIVFPIRSLHYNMKFHEKQQHFVATYSCDSQNNSLQNTQVNQ